MKKNRWIHPAVLVVVVLFSRSSFPANYSGTVVDRDNNAPIPGVLVGSGFSLHRTITDSNGRFTLNAPNAARTPRFTASSSGVIRWNIRTRTIDLSGADDIAAVSIYRLNGNRMFRASRYPGRYTITVPAMPPGIYIAFFSGTGSTSFVRRITTASQQGVVTVSLPAYRHTPIVASSAGERINAIFRHDKYYPIDSGLVAPAENLVIGMKADPRSFVFDESTVHTYRFVLSREDSLAMERDATDEPFNRAEFTFDDTLFGTVGLRYKGSKYSLERCFDSVGNRSSYPDCRNVSLKIKFNEYNDTCRFHLLKKLNLHAMGYDNSKLREILAYGIFRDMGIVTCRTAFAKVYVNGVYRGLFAAVEDVDGRFTKSRWPADGDGNLYKEAWPKFIDAKNFRDALVTNEKPEGLADVSRMFAFGKVAKTTTQENFRTDIALFMDIDYWLRYITVDRAIHNADGIMTWYSGCNHNYYFYEEPRPTGRFWIIPWDLNATFDESDPIIDGFGVPEWNVVPENCDLIPVWSGNLAKPPNCDKLIGLTAAVLWKEFVDMGKEFLGGLFKPERMRGQVDRLTAVIAPIMTDEPWTTEKDWKKQVDNLRRSMDVLYHDFDDHINNRDLAKPVDTAGFLDPFPGDSGFLINRVNNFEFSTLIPFGSWAGTAISPNSSISLSHDTAAPLWGKADMLCSYVFRPADTAKTYAEWAVISFNFGATTDLSKLRQVRINLTCDAPPRSYTLCLESDAYEKDNAGRYCWSGYMGEKDRQFIAPVSNITFPSWAAAPKNPDMFDSVITSVKGISIRPQPRFAPDGKLAVPLDSGYVRIDNVIFDF